MRHGRISWSMKGASSPSHMEVDDEKTASPVPSPDGKWIAFIKNQNIYVKEKVRIKFSIPMSIRNG